jgi:hypothetical protein
MVQVMLVIISWMNLMMNITKIHQLIEHNIKQIKAHLKIICQYYKKTIQIVQY